MDVDDAAAEGCENLSTVFKTLKTSWSEEASNSVFPIITASSSGSPIQILVDNCNEGTLISRDLVDRLQLKMHNGPQTCITGVSDILNLRTSSYATVPAIFDNKHFNISGTVVNSICSDITMENLHVHHNSRE